MPLNTRFRRQIEGFVEDLNPQPYKAQLDRTMEFDEASDMFGGLSVLDIQYVLVNWKIHLWVGSDGPWWLPIWANNGRPYIRLRDPESRKSVDVFLLPA